MVEEYIVIKGDTYKEALYKGLEALNLREEEVQIEILEEQKSFFLKKGFVKLKITPKLISKNNKDQANVTTGVLNKIQFSLDYRSDGVFLTVLKPCETNLEDLVNFLNKKKVKQYDYEKIRKCLENKEEIAEKIAPYQDEVLIDSTILINVSKDRCKVSILLTEPIGGKLLSSSDIIENLNKSGIVFGINYAEIENIVSNNIFNKYVIIAEGIKAINGQDGSIVYYFNDDTNKNLIINEEGRIDYKNLDKIDNVNKGTLLMEIIPPTEGINGKDVYETEIACKIGKSPYIKRGKNVVDSEDKLKIFAHKDGEVHFTGDTIYVDEVLNLTGNIDNETGNIQFNGKINIKGNIKSGFKVEAEGDIQVGGVVEGAILASKGNIIVHGGVQGNNIAYIECLGNLTTKYIENASVKCGRNVECDAILHSNIITKEKIIVLGRKGLIAGGDIRAGYEVRANVVGSSMGTVTKIEVGIDPEEKAHYEDIKCEMVNIEKGIDSSKKAIELLNKISKKQKLSTEKEELLIKSIKTHKVLIAKHEQLSKELQYLYVKFQESNKGKLHALNTIHPGTKVVIGSSSKQVYDQISSCTLCIRNGEISIDPYEK